MDNCNCIECMAKRLGYAHDKCLSPPPTTEYAYRKSTKDFDPVCLIPIVILALSAGMAVGKYWL